jgi:hypothetical protein
MKKEEQAINREQREEKKFCDAEERQRRQERKQLSK